MEVWRRLRLFFSAFEEDAIIRHPESRLRLSLELRSSVSASDAQLFEDILDRFQRAKKKISFLDLPLLIEWTERKEMALCISRIQSCDFSTSKDDIYAEACRQRLLEIADEMRRSVPSTDPDFFHLLKHRWYFAALRDEAEYLLNRLSCLCLAKNRTNS